MFEDRFDPKIAEGFVQASRTQTGLPAFLGMATTHIGPGTMSVDVPVRDDLKNPFGNLHGGVLAALVDHVLGAVAYPIMERGRWAATTEFKLNYLAPVTQGTVTATSTVITMTRRTAVVRVDVTNEGRTCCIAQGTLLLVDPR